MIDLQPAQPSSIVPAVTQTSGEFALLIPISLIEVLFVDIIIVKKKCHYVEGSVLPHPGMQLFCPCLNQDRNELNTTELLARTVQTEFKNQLYCWGPGVTCREDKGYWPEYPE
ncbi:uncharacterized protein [Scyliorhinus torazame]|uniref:uncharacterized protein isoform X2 n=1 Tax=Scyliorhinus torazame TaxID=75743 RepID=UPI003B5CE4A6